jgi:general secretion pathway protein N
MKRRYLVLLGLLAFLVTLVLHAPAAVLYAWTHPEKNPAGARLHGVEGTLVDGGFAALTVNNRAVLSEAQWHLKPAWLALLRFTADLEAGGDSVVRMRVSRAVLGKLRLSDISAAGSVKSLLGVLGQPSLPVEGQARLEMPMLRLDEGLPVEVEGNAEIENLSWTLAKDPLLLGSFSAALSTDDKGILVSLSSGKGPIELSGTATLGKEKAYEVTLQLRPRQEAPQQVQTLVRSLGAPDAQGWYHIRRSGKLS